MSFDKLSLQKGYNPKSEFETLSPDENGQYTIEIKELERLVISLEDPDTSTDNKNILPFPGKHYDGYLANGDELKPLPIGSTLDPRRGIFYWQPGPGFLGEFRLVFFKTDQEGNIIEKDVRLNIIPEF